jgi:hypothetical protein
MILKIFSPHFLAKKLAFLTQSKAKLRKILIITLVFEKNANFFAEIVKIAKNCYHNIDPTLPLNEDLGVGAVEGDADALRVDDLDVVEVPRDRHLALFHLFLEAALELDVFALVLDLRRGVNVMMEIFSPKMLAKMGDLE